ncbi:hypothetical protein JL721_5306 [Aureococcus anophagefferens]|nr:hypothetical protein JL721_5306 [Aureococcus anophagefferens]
MASGSWSAPMVSAGAGAAADGPVVALTREQGKNDGLAAALEGVASVEIPAVAQTRTADMEAALDAALLFVDEAWDWVVITSPEAARTFGDAATRSGVSMMRDARWRGFRLAAVGAATADALRARETGGWRDVHAPAKATAASLAASLPRNESRPHERAAACIGETSARACEDLGFSAVFFPDKPGIPGWAASVRDAVASPGAE